MAADVIQLPLAPEAVPFRLMHPTDESAALLGVGRSVLYGLLRNDVIPSIRLGGKRLVARADLEAYVDRLRSQAEPYADTAP
ncbi:helix-turn-helix domain-containing protein [Modestobacter sp. VKM Ac-2985]|uniref:helix-turn-helix domain-containing protein n=1 Tax=Modestobacter sp. VKM Ac-2985 TaxID=3004139 RepID=UPI0022AB81A7|nr:helix-turn-helix domain-containing protein [Modestobacter sp. VKM Ac-2985]MCZ2837179.1 helix-turn-helix domain-containing protein [Modestobacter sp. VKM Ac-2985]